MGSNLINVEIIPTDKPESPEAIQTLSFEDAIKEAFQKRPDLQQQYYNLKNADVDVKATKNALLPTATLGHQYQSAGLAGNSSITGNPATIAGVPIVDANGVPVAGLFVPSAFAPVTGKSQQGFGTAQSQIFHNDFPIYAGQLTFSLPLRNRSNQADNIHAQLVMRQFEAQVQQVKNTALLDVRNTTIAVEQGRAQVQAATKARELQQQTFDAEQKKYQLGASTVYNVILTQRDLITAQGNELRRRESCRSQGQLRTRARTHPGSQQRETDRKQYEDHHREGQAPIPGTLNGQVVGTEELIKALDDASGSGHRSGLVADLESCDALQNAGVNPPLQRCIRCGTRRCGSSLRGKRGISFSQEPKGGTL